MERGRNIWGLVHLGVAAGIATAGAILGELVITGPEGPMVGFYFSVFPVGLYLIAIELRRAVREGDWQDFEPVRDGFLVVALAVSVFLMVSGLGVASIVPMLLGRTDILLAALPAGSWLAFLGFGFSWLLLSKTRLRSLHRIKRQHKPWLCGVAVIAAVVFFTFALYATVTMVHFYLDFGWTFGPTILRITASPEREAFCARVLVPEDDSVYLVVARDDGTPLRSLVLKPERAKSAKFVLGPEGKDVYFATSGHEERVEVVRVDVESGKETSILSMPYNGSEKTLEMRVLAVDHSGRQVFVRMVERNYQEDKSVGQLVAVDVATGDLTPLTPKCVASASGCEWTGVPVPFAISADGKTGYVRVDDAVLGWPLGLVEGDIHEARELVRFPEPVRFATVAANKKACAAFAYRGPQHGMTVQEYEGRDKSQDYVLMLAAAEGTLEVAKMRLPGRYSFSPSGQKLAWIEHIGKERRKSEIHVFDVSRQTEVALLPLKHAMGIAWKDDDTLLCYTHRKCYRWRISDTKAVLLFAINRQGVAIAAAHAG